MMIRRAFMVGAVSAVALILSADSFAQQSQTGTAREAQAMLTKTVAAMKADKTNTIAMINKGEGGFLQGDIYPCTDTPVPKVSFVTAVSEVGCGVGYYK
jgi:hypothetical protein